jgi:hypothetical protein
MGEPIGSGQFKVRLLSAVAAAVVAAVAMTLLQPAGASRQEQIRKDGLDAASWLAENAVVREEFPQLSKVGDALVNDKRSAAKRAAQDILDHPERTRRQAQAVLASEEWDTSGQAAGRARLAVVNPFGPQIQPQINIGAIVCPILNAIRAAFASTPFASFIVPLIDSLLNAFGCQSTPTATTTTGQAGTTTTVFQGTTSTAGPTTTILITTSTAGPTTTILITTSTAGPTTTTTVAA